MNLDFWYERIPIKYMGYYRFHLERLPNEFDALDNKKASSFHSESYFRYYDQYIKDEEMPRPKKKDNQNDTKASSRPTAKPVWINVSLSDDDAPAIERYGDNSNDIFAEIIELVDMGFDVGVKYTDGGESRMAYLIGVSSNDANALCGLSGFASNAYDAVTVLLYKFTVSLNRELNTPTGNNKPRFR